MKQIPKTRAGFTIIELMTVLVIIVIVASMSAPYLDRVIEKARSAACGANLRAIGAAVQACVVDNDNNYPLIEPYPTDPVYPADQGVSGMYGVLGPYGLDKKNLQCPDDLQRDKYFQSEGTSYMWSPLVDGENQNAITIYGRRVFAIKTLSRLRLCTDFTSPSGVGPHSGNVNSLYADGHVVLH